LKRLTSATNPESGTISYAYDNNGNLTSKVDARSITSTFVYDSLNRVTSRSYSDGTPTVTYTYDAAGVTNSKGRVTSTSSSVSVSNVTAYDVLGRVTAGNQVTDGQTYSMSYSYNRAGAQTSFTYPSGRVISVEYDPASRMAGVRDQQSGLYYAGAAGSDSTNRIKYSVHGGVSVMKLGNNLWEHTDFNSRLQSTEIGLGSSSTDSSTLRLTYNYGTTNNNGNLQSVSYLGGGLSYTQSFGYDVLNRLTTSVESGGSWAQTNKYDRYGNRAIDLGGGNQSLYFNSANRITNAGYTYDTAGNLTSDGVQSFGYNAENKIKSVNGVSDVYRYDGDGNRVRKNFATGEKLRMVYSGGQLVAEYDLTNGSLKKEYIYGAKGLIATVEPVVGTRYTTSDHLGSPRVVTNSSAGIVSRHDYMPFGEEIGSGVGGRTVGIGFIVNDGVRQKFTAKERDVETGLDYFLARYYSSSQGRFSSVDPGSFVPADPQSWDRYVYTQNNPLKFTDPTGKDLYITGDYADQLVSDLARFSGYKLKRDSKTGKVTIEPDQKRKGEDTSYSLARALERAIGKETVAVSIHTVSESKDKVPVIGDKFSEKKVDIDDYNVFKRDAPELAAGFLTHVITEYYEDQLLAPPLSLRAIFESAHTAALEAESETVGDFNGYWQAPRESPSISPGLLNSPSMTVRFKYSTVEYDVVYKTGVDGRATQANQVTKIEKTPKKPK
jgi:RHS repeat-associated protein